MTLDHIEKRIRAINKKALVVTVINFVVWATVVCVAWAYRH